MNGQQEVEKFAAARIFVYLLAVVFLLGQIGNTLFAEADQAFKARKFPYPLHYVEGLALDEQMRATDLSTLYPAHFDTPPHTVTASPPLFYWLTRVFTPQGAQPYIAGRTISMLSALAAAIFAGLLCWATTRSFVSSLLAGAFLLMYPVVTHWGIFDTPEMLAFALSLGGLCALLMLKGRKAVAASAILWLCAAATATSLMVTPLITGCIWLLQQKRRPQALALAVSVLAGIVAGALALNALTQGGFLLNTVTMSLRGYDLALTLGFMFNILLRSAFLLLISIVFLGVERLGEQDRAHGSEFSLIFLLTALAVTLLTGRIGTNLTGTLMLVAAMCVSTGTAFAWLGRNWVIRFGMLAMLFVQLTPLEEWRANEFTPDIQQKLRGRQEISQLAAQMRDAGGDVLTDEHIGILLTQGQKVYIYPQEFRQLMVAGLWSEKSLINAINNRQFKLIALYEPVSSNNGPLIVTRWSLSVLDAISENYQLSPGYADTQIFVPR